MLRLRNFSSKVETGAFETMSRGRYLLYQARSIRSRVSRSSRSRRSIYSRHFLRSRNKKKKTVALGRLHRIRRKIRRSGLNVAWPGCKGCQRRPRDGLDGRVQGAKRRGAEEKSGGGKLGVAELGG